jgi:hypothetical protein
MTRPRLRSGLRGKEANMRQLLTPKQEKFCLEYLECGNASKAYRTAYNAAKMKDATVNRKAFELLQGGNVTARIDGLRAESAKIAVLTQAGVISDLIKIKDRAMAQDASGEFKNPDLAVKALELLGRNVQAWKPETMLAIQVNNGGNSRESFEDVLDRSIIIRQEEMPDEETKRSEATAVGELYRRWRDGEVIEPHPVLNCQNMDEAVKEFLFSKDLA